MGLLWERSLTRTTYKHKCSDIHPSFKFADLVTRDCLKNRTWAPVNITQCVMDSDSPVVMIVIINLASDNSPLVKSREELIYEEVQKHIDFFSPLCMQLYLANVKIFGIQTSLFTTFYVTKFSNCHQNLMPSCSCTVA